jgi:nicotinic acetylcholine receptor
MNADLNDYSPSGTWDIIECPGDIVTVRTGSGNETRFASRLVYKLRLRRKTLFYMVTLIIPCVLISFLSLAIFYLPSDAGEKMTMCISVLLALVVFLLLVSKLMPPTSTVPLISKYLLFTFIMNIFTIVITVIIINWNFRSPRTHRMPSWIRVIFLNYLPRILFMMRPHHDERCKGGGATYTRRLSLFGTELAGAASDVAVSQRRQRLEQLQQATSTTSAEAAATFCHATMQY